MYTIGIYPRKSVYRDNSDSVSVQIKLCKDYAGIMFKDRESKFKIYDKDEGFSGKNMNRPSFKELMGDVKNNRLNAVIVYKLDRISRNVQEFSAMYEIFQQYNVSFISVKESFDTTTPMGRTVMYILAAFAQLERENTSERVTDNMLALGASGKWTGGRLPAGMCSVRRLLGEKEHSYLVVDKKTIGLVTLLYELTLQGFPLTRIERHCRDNGIKSQTGKFLNTSQIYNILTNPVYCQNSIEAYSYFKNAGCTLPEPTLFDGSKGLIGYGKTKAEQTSQKRRKSTNWTIAAGTHEAVISSSEWIAVQKRLGVNKMIRSAKYKSGILKGVLRCKCGARMDVRTYVKNGAQFSYYYCTDMYRQGKEKCSTGYVRVEQVEQAFLKELCRISLPASGYKPRRSSLRSPQNVSAIKSEIKYMQESIGNLTSALTQAMDTAASGYIIQQIDELDKQKKILEINALKNTRRDIPVLSLADTEKETHDSIRYLLEHFDAIEYSGKNELIRKIVKTCVLDNNNLHVVF